MDAKEYVQKRNALNESISSIQREMAQLRREYLNEHCQYKVGDKVHVIVPEYTSKFYPYQGQLMERQEFDAFVCHNIEIDQEGRIRPTLHQVKKDGTESTRYVYLPSESNPIITKL